MTKQQWNLYQLIKSKTEFSDESMTVEEICNALPEFYKLNAKESNFTNCPTLYQDIDEINTSTEVDKIIIKNNNHFRLATFKEANEFLSKIKSRAVKQLMIYYKTLNKINNNGQYKLLSNQGNIIDEESKAHKYIDSFVKDCSPLETWEWKDLVDEYLRLCNETGNVAIRYDRATTIKEIKKMRKDIEQ